MKKCVIGILAHVDAGKTTLSESMLFLSGKTRKLGRVDDRDAYLDTYEMEKKRGITIFSKQALFECHETSITLLDTPGHVDFSAEMERTLQVLDYAILVINGAEGVQGHTMTLWRLLKLHQIPTFLFINKMDQGRYGKEVLIKQLRERLDMGCVDFSNKDTSFYEEVAMASDEMMTYYLEHESVEEEAIKEAINKRDIFPCFFGSALKLEGIDYFLEQLTTYMKKPVQQNAFGAKVYKITRDTQGNRLTFMKITGGVLRTKDLIKHKLGEWEEKINQIRIYSGEKYEAVSEIKQGAICAVTGLSKTVAGDRLGIEEETIEPILEPVLTYQIQLPEEVDVRTILPKLYELEEEEPSLKIVWNEALGQIEARLMGEIQTEILQAIIKERFDVLVTFSEGDILYKETITNKVEGVGHFEPLKHYAEVHLILEPLERGKGIIYTTNCSEDILERNWQRLVLSHLHEKQHKGALIGAPITDVKITLVAGAAHKKHTEGGDFREATFRAVRQGVKQAASKLLEPYYAFELTIPATSVGRAMHDIEKMNGTCKLESLTDEEALIVGSAPVVTMRYYHQEVTSYTKGMGRLVCMPEGYKDCHNEVEIIKSMGYDTERDIDNPTGSVFCSHGTGFLVPWDEVQNYMHIESILKPQRVIQKEEINQPVQEEVTIGLEEIDKIINGTAFANQGQKAMWQKKKVQTEQYFRPGNTTYRTTGEKKQAYLLVDGYNIIFAWEDLNEIAKDNMEGAKVKLLECLCNYQGIKANEIMVVFDAYKVKGHQTEISQYQGLKVVYTKEAETADHFIEKFAHQNHDKYQVTVATSDALEQVIIRGKGCMLLSARELKEELERVNKQTLTTYEEAQKVEKNYLLEHMDDTLIEEIKKHF